MICSSVTRNVTSVDKWILTSGLLQQARKNKGIAAQEKYDANPNGGYAHASVNIKKVQQELLELKRRDIRSFWNKNEW